VPLLEQAGHTVHALTLPGMESVDADRSGIHLGDHVDAVVAAIDAVPKPAEVVLAGHSAGGGLAYAASGPQPGATVREAHHHPGKTQRGIPSTVVACELPGPMMRQLMEQDHPYVAELKTLADYEIVDLPTGHWPMFTKPKELAEVMIAAVAPGR
jgi:pimeloyl-ACP methyl ester carboxylesterase